MTGKKRKRNNFKDPTLREFLNKVKTEVLVQEASDSDFLKQANRFYSHRNLNNGLEPVDVNDEIEELPTLKHIHMQEFAFRYAMEARSLAFWSRELKINNKTLATWLKRKDVTHFITALKRQRYFRFSVMRTRIEEAAMKELLTLIQFETTNENYASKAKLIMEVLMFDPHARKSLQAQIQGARDTRNGPGNEIEDKRKEMRQVGETASDVIPGRSEIEDIEDAIEIVG